jgi:hypothetical protein
MKRTAGISLGWIMAALLAACSFPGVAPEAPQGPQAPPATETRAVTPTERPSSGAPAGGRPDEAIAILEPGPGSRLISPVRVAGVADPTFEQTLVVRVVLVDGRELAVQPVTIAADLGQRGPFEGWIEFSVDGEQQAFIQVFSESPRDGGVTHLASVGVVLAEGGLAEVFAAEAYAEQIAIFQPVSGATVSGGVVQVAGFGLAGFEGTLVIEVHDAGGNVVGAQAITVMAPDLGLPGPFQGAVPYTLGVAGPGRIVVRDISPAFGGDSHLAGVEVTLTP